MKRRTFLKKSAMGIGTLAGWYGGMLKAQGESRDPTMAALLSGNGLRDLQAQGQCAWGVNAVFLQSPWTITPSAEDMLADTEHTLKMNRFYRVGGQNQPVTPTECSIAYNHDTLFVMFRCTESDMSFPYATLNKDWWPTVDWYSLRGLPSAANNWPPNPDEVDFLIQPDTSTPSYYQFAATLQGLTFGCNRLLHLDPGVPADKDVITDRHDLVRARKLEGFQANVTKRSDDWLALFQIPWQILGGKPQSHFGFLPMRTRWRDGEFSSPVAIDFNEGMPVDVLIETHFSGAQQAKDSETSLCKLPSGTFRWQRPALLAYPSVETCRQIWQMQLSLATPTDQNNLEQRLHLTQCWMELMTQEGFVPYQRAWGVMKSDMTLAFIRQKVNVALRKNDQHQACQLLDTYLTQLDAISRWWYADGSPGDILKDEWKPITSADSLEVQNETLLMKCRVGSKKVDLRLSLPSTGGVRICGREEGYWRSVGLLPLNATPTSSSCSIETADGRIVIERDPFSISFYDSSGNRTIRIGAQDFAFRFSSDDSIIAVEFRNHLDPNEVIYGFGEKYDHFDKRGTVLTLWGTDDWVGNGEGLANSTYKALPIFHSSKGYMAFSNSSYRLRADVGKADPNEYRITQQGPILDYYFWIGTPEKALPSYTALTGRPPLPPKWVFEPWMGRGEGAWTQGPLHNAVAEEESVALRFSELDIPHSAIYAEGPSALSPELNQFMAARGIRVLGYFYPVIPLERQHRLMLELKQSELPYLRFANGDVAPDPGDTYVDFTNPRAMELCRRALREALDLGEAGSMVDFGDMTPDGALFYDGKRGAEMHNFFYYDYQRTVSEVFREKRGNDFILYARGAAPGTQKWVGQFAGDHPSNFNGLKHVVTGALNLCACGYSLWGSDVGGYFGFPEPAVYMRWFQFGLFSPLMRPHGVAPRDPWFFGEAAVTNYKFLAWTRENILNYTYNAAAIAHETGVPIMRSMPVAFPEEREIANSADQYMFGPDLLVAPVVNEETYKMIGFPSGTWTSLWNGETVTGPVTRKVDAPLDTIPAYLKPGAVMPVQLNPGLQFGESMAQGRVDALVVTLSTQSEQSTLLNARGEAAQVAVQSASRHSSWTLKNLPEMTHLLIYGTASAASVTVDGEVLTQATAATDLSSMPVGWAADQASNRIVVHLPTRKGENSDPIVEIAVDLESGK